MKVILGISLLLLTSCGESLEAGRLVYRDKRCVSNGDRGEYCKVKLGRYSYCYEYMGMQVLSIDCKIYEEARRGVWR